MLDGEHDLERLRRWAQERAYESEQIVARWRETADAHLAENDTAVFDAPVDDAAAPKNAPPPQYREVVDKFDAGELDWEHVLAGGADDDAGRAMSMWMDRRLQQIEDVGWLVRRGKPIEDAYAEVAERSRR
jgi:hypothetical protein